MRSVLESVNLRFFERSSNKVFWKDQTLAELVRVNHPNNCYRVDLGKLEFDLTDLIQVQFNFYANSSQRVEILMEDKRRSLSRTFKYNSFGMSGTRFLIGDVSKNYYK